MAMSHFLLSGNGRRSAEKAPDSQAKYDADRCKCLRPVNLGRTVTTILKENRRLADATSCPLAKI
jgi:hypothetical protein